MVEKFSFPSMPRPTHSYPEGSPEWIWGMSMRLGLNLESTERNGASHLSRTLRSVLPHKPWLHVPIGKPCLDPKKWLEGSTGHDWQAVYFCVKPFDRDLADLIENECSASRTSVKQQAVPALKAANPHATQAQIGDMVGLSQGRVAQVLLENRVYTPKTNTPRKVAQYKISQYTKPATAADKIRATFGPDFARQLKDAL